MELVAVVSTFLSAMDKKHSIACDPLRKQQEKMVDFGLLFFFFNSAQAVFTYQMKNQANTILM